MRHSPWSTRPPSAAASASASATRRVFPTPDSPATTSTEGRPPAAAASASLSSASSGPRPTKRLLLTRPITSRVSCHPVRPPAAGESGERATPALPPHVVDAGPGDLVEHEVVHRASRHPWSVATCSSGGGSAASVGRRPLGRPTPYLRPAAPLPAGAGEREGRGDLADSRADAPKGVLVAPPGGRDAVGDPGPDAGHLGDPHPARRERGGAEPDARRVERLARVEGHGVPVADDARAR